jgi:hypothetical protein
MSSEKFSKKEIAYELSGLLFYIYAVAAFCFLVLIYAKLISNGVIWDVSLQQDSMTIFVLLLFCQIFITVRFFTGELPRLETAICSLITAATILLPASFFISDGMWELGSLLAFCSVTFLVMGTPVLRRALRKR